LSIASNALDAPAGNWSGNGMPFRRRAKEAGFDADAIERLGRILDEVWLEVGDAFAAEPTSIIDEARNVLSKALFYHARNGHDAADVLRLLAKQALAQAYPRVPF
jgi:hypothetical protein